MQNITKFTIQSSHAVLCVQFGSLAEVRHQE